MPESLLLYLTRPNPRITCRGSGSSTFTFNESWSPVENLEPWDEFTYTNLVSVFHHDLERVVDLNNPTPQCEAATFNELYDEQMLGHLVASSIMIPVSSALPNELFTGGGKTWKNADCFPDWSAGNKYRFQENGRPKATTLGDTKYKWSHEDAIRMMRSNPDGYEHAGREVLRPIEQIQFYCASYKCRFGFLITEKGLLAIEAYQDTDIQRSPRPRRNIQPRPHQRVPSSTTVDMSISGISEALTDMSVISSSLGPGPIRLLKYAFVPWEAQGVGKLTIKLALYCISLIASEASELKPDYAPLTTLAQLSTRSLKQAPAPTKPGGSQTPRNSAEKGKAPATNIQEPIPSTSTPISSDVPRFLDVVVTWNNNHDGYRYNQNGKWVFNDSPSSWQTVGDKIYKFGAKPPHLRSKKPS